ncbi:uncharacterized protein N7459_003255 [Penicillium hispanicum]|uniref:uncharacterized protein n=1 Tax=Penicillium hispanicum TaxID=1080232 RepID=UPI0025425950|nr:uncharacterized protein N7459_003255 [Penicillium hispanicum]KAJ5587490.1 hypothetical protein N7459_003255 [Penicillium hispanicum]
MFSYLHERTSPTETQTALIRIAWGCYILEWDDLAEFHFPRSGIEILIDDMLFPEFTDPTDRDNLTRHVLQPKTLESHPQHHLETWFESLPECIKPDLRDANPRDLRDNQLRSRYYATKHIICRPCLVLAAQSREEELSGYIVANCVSLSPTGRADSTLFQSLTLMIFSARLSAAVFVLAIAKSTPSLASLVQDSDSLIERAIQSTKPWARDHETADSILGMFKAIRQKLRFPITTT